MAIVKPDLSQQWASDGDKIAPSGAKIQAGWGPEIPPYQWENFIQNRQDEMLAYLNERGIPEWDNRTDYIGDGKSYVQGSDGVIYKSVTDNGLSTTVQDPVVDSAGTYWTPLVTSSTETQQGIIRIGTQGEVNNGVLNDVAVTPLTLKAVVDSSLAPAATETVSGILRIGTQAEADAGTLDDVAVTPKKLRMGFSASLAEDGYIAFPSWLGGLVIQWGRVNVGTTPVNYSFPITWPTMCFSLVGSDSLNSVVSAFSFEIKTNSQFSAACTNSGGNSGLWIAIGH